MKISYETEMLDMNPVKTLANVFDAMHSVCLGLLNHCQEVTSLYHKTCCISLHSLQCAYIMHIKHTRYDEFPQILFNKEDYVESYLSF